MRTRPSVVIPRGAQVAPLLGCGGPHPQPVKTGRPAFLLRPRHPSWATACLLDVTAPVSSASGGIGREAPKQVKGTAEED